MATNEVYPGLQQLTICLNHDSEYEQFMIINSTHQHFEAATYWNKTVKMIDVYSSVALRTSQFKSQFNSNWNILNTFNYLWILSGYTLCTNPTKLDD